MNRLVLIIVCFVFCLNVSSRPIRDVWLEMPDSIIPHVNKKIRKELLHLIDMKMPSEANNLLGEKTVIDTLTSEYMSVALSESLLLQMRLLPAIGGDSILCVVRSYGTSFKESVVSLYTPYWKKISDIEFDINMFVHKPDTMQTEKYEELKLMLDPYLISAELSEYDDTLVVSASATNISNEDKILLDAIFLQRKFKWNGRVFN